MKLTDLLDVEGQLAVVTSAVFAARTRVIAVATDVIPHSPEPLNRAGIGPGRSDTAA